jgi:xylan 1,4-beta-xylosidase
MGSPQYPTREQMLQLRKAADLPAPEQRSLDTRSELTLDLPPEGIALVESL